MANATITITGQVIDSIGAVWNFSTNAVQDNLGGSAGVVPLTAPPGSTRTLTVAPAGGVGPFVFGVPSSPGVTFTPITGSPGQWTFVY